MNRKKLLILSIVLVAILSSAFLVYYKILRPQLRRTEWENKTKELNSQGTFKEGDLIFQSSSSRQTKAIQLATHSDWSHVGIILRNNNELVVYEAVQPVKYTPLAVWLSRSTNGIFAVKRLINSDSVLNPDNINKLKIAAEKFIGKNYDIYFGWSDEKIYCSEYIWKIYKSVLNIEIGKLQKLKDFDLSDPEVKKIMEERYGNSPPLEEDVISPVSMYNSVNLRQIYP